MRHIIKKVETREFNFVAFQFYQFIGWKTYSCQREKLHIKYNIESITKYFLLSDPRKYLVIQ